MMKNIRFKVPFSTIKAFLYRIVIRHADTTAYLLTSPANAERLLKGIEDYEQGLGRERRLIGE